MVGVVDQYGSVLLFTGTFCIAYVLWRKVKGSNDNLKSRLPPSLPSYPIVGSVFHLPSFRKFHRGLLEWKKSKGGVLAFYLGPRLAVVLQGREAIHEALVKNSVEFAHRSPSFLKLVTNPGTNGIIDRHYDPTFKRLHHVSLTILKKLGFGKGIMEDRINREVELFVSKVTEMNGKSFFPDPLLSVSVMNVIGTILFGQSFRESNETQRDVFISDVYRFVRDLMKVAVLNSLPFLRFVPGLRGRYLQLCDTHDRMMTFLEYSLDNSLNGNDGGEPEVSFSSSFREEEDSKYDRTELLYILRDLMVAGTETSVTSLRWTLVELANRPELQKKVQDEIDSVVGKSGRLPSLDDRPNLPLFDATILELMRYHTVAPLSVPRANSIDVELYGNVIPKETMVFTSLYSVHMDTDVWKDPSAFQPERFLSPDGKQVIGRERLMPFGIGRRSCVGELLARQEMFLFVAGILQRFDIRPPEGSEQITCHEIQTITLAPSPFDIRLIPRSVG